MFVGDMQIKEREVTLGPWDGLGHLVEMGHRTMIAVRNHLRMGYDLVPASPIGALRLVAREALTAFMLAWWEVVIDFGIVRRSLAVKRIGTVEFVLPRAVAARIDVAPLLTEAAGAVRVRGDAAALSGMAVR